MLLTEGEPAMQLIRDRKISFCLLIVLIVMISALSACSSDEAKKAEEDQNSGASSYSADFITAVEEEPDTNNFQATTYYYTVATNVFDRLVETKTGKDGTNGISPSLAESWEISDDRRTYTFHLRDDVQFSNGEELTSDDVLYTFSRLLTDPESCNQDIARVIKGADQLESGRAKSFKGFRVISDRDFSITLKKPFEAFLSSLSTPAASIMNRESAEEAGDRFGTDPNAMVGTGPYIFAEWEHGERMVLRANIECWSGAPENEGVQILFLSDPEYIRTLYDDGGLDIMDLDDLDNSAEYYIHGDIYQDGLQRVQRVGVTYIALNGSVEPLDDVRVRKALQLSVDRRVLLDAVYGGRGELENGIFPHGLYGFNETLAEIPYDIDKATELLTEAGYPNGFDMTISVKSTSSRWEDTMMRLTASMWKRIGVNAKIEILSEADFMKRRKKGRLTCYTATWTADYNDPDNFIYTFFGDKNNTRFRSLCYSDNNIMHRVRSARMIADPEKRIREYRDLEKKIIQDDAAWIPLFSRVHLYMLSDRITEFAPIWNGSVRSNYRTASVKKEN